MAARRGDGLGRYSIPTPHPGYPAERRKHPRIAFQAGRRDGRNVSRDDNLGLLRRGARIVASIETEDMGRRAYFLGFARGVRA